MYISRRMFTTATIVMLLATGCGDTSDDMYKADYGCVHVDNQANKATFATDKKVLPQATEILFNEIPADITVKAAKTKGTPYSFEAPKEVLSALKWSSASGNPNSLTLGFTCPSNRLKLTRLPKLILTVDKGTDLRFWHSAGFVSVGDTYGSLDVELGGVGDIKAGTVADLNTIVTGDGGVDVSKATGTVDVNVFGTGDVHVGDASHHTELRATSTGDVIVEGNEIPYLYAKASGTGSVTFTGHADEAELAASETGDITVGSVGNATQSTSGTGDINIG